MQYDQSSEGKATLKQVEGILQASSKNRIPRVGASVNIDLHPTQIQVVHIMQRDSFKAYFGRQVLL